MGVGSSGLSAGGGGGGFRQMSDQEIIAYYAGQDLTEAQQAAIDLYTTPYTEMGSLYNFSQNMNYAVANSLPLSGEKEQVFNEINNAMHDIGYKAQLTRYDHADTVNDMLKQIGIQENAAYMTPEQLKNALQGVAYSDARILSTSVNNFKNASDPSVFTTRQFKFTYKAKPKAKGVMPGMGNNSDNFGEFLLGPQNKYKIADVKYSGAKARKKGGSKHKLTLDQIEIVVEVD